MTCERKTVKGIATVPRIVTFGEIMIRLQPCNHERFAQTNHLEFGFGGSAANVAVTLANYGIDTAYVTKIPTNTIGQCAVDSLRRYNVDTSLIVRGGNRMGICFSEKGFSWRDSFCIYDLAHSAIQEATTADFDWDNIFDGVDWFHFACLSPALSPNVGEICKEACLAARRKGAFISCDLNFRGMPWLRQQASETVLELCRYVNVCISNVEAANDVFGIKVEETHANDGRVNLESYKSVAYQMADRFGFEIVAITLQESHNTSEAALSALLYDVADDRYCFSPKYDFHIIDQLGSDDSFNGGLIYALLSGKSTQEAVKFAVANSVLKQSLE
ncbi:MAG: sugar kinase [Victivallales bacterium]|nr:sugar kinase [Victivallales bacterium]